MSDDRALIDELVSQVAEIIDQDERRKIEAAERQRCIEDVCPYCAGDMQEYLPAGRVGDRAWTHLARSGTHGAPCGAGGIHERIAREQGR